MSATTGISWTDHTFNPWWGCRKVSPGCRFCYADIVAHRYGHDNWGAKVPRRMFGHKHWAEPAKWNRDAERAKIPARVFCASMADVFEDHPDLVAPRQRLFDLIEVTPWLHWQLLTKRPENVAGMVPWSGDWPSNAWLGTSCEDQRRADERVPHLLAAPASVRFLSCEPLLGPVDLSSWLPELQWVIVGGESGTKARPMHPDWARRLRDQCAEAEVPFHFKQWGRWSPMSPIRPDGRYHTSDPHITLADDGTVYQPGELAFDGGSRWGEALRAGHAHGRLTSMYSHTGKSAGRKLDDRTWDDFPAANAPVTS